ncbi:hypothetical protein [Micromonospora sp. NPDC004551]|uniref:hypothetical protein n=1 Tax=Micromonospora sp. NPDC004551 TaxID=3154284 RepID=UPI0033BD9846
MTRIEIYSTGSLDASAYTCNAHTAGALAAITEAGLDSQPVTLSPTVSRPCGYVHVYPTGQLADTTRPPHPPWCDRIGCDQRGRHRSIRLPVSTGHPEAVIVDVALIQVLGHGVEPMLAMTVVDSEAGSRETVLSLGQGRVLSYQVRRLLDLSKGYSGNRRPSW